MSKIAEIVVVLHNADGTDVITSYPLRSNEEAWSIHNAKAIHSAMENFRNYINDGYKASMHTLNHG